ncbi:hypothetical protein BofuT4_P059570.1 [Botrytis cinerea T4]|uniref:Uncharacterized protein n=1 Tax=Botryotinia fuckeliana (strain T4) TaxID=999810 RepID=G2XV57_BOTF4|nr:hypothetical protein BofuT4_P059570.1 [Botrytis cinerea T4]
MISKSTIARFHLLRIASFLSCPLLFFLSIPQNCRKIVQLVALYRPSVTKGTAASKSTAQC